MKRIVYTFLVLVLVSNLDAQSVPTGINYQAVARSVDGQPLSNQQIEVRISFTSAEEQASTYYTEDHLLVTNELGLFQLLVGSGKSAQSDLLEVPWEEEAIWMEVAIKTAASDKYQLVSSSQVLSVPYALHAQKTLALDDQSETILRNQRTRWLTSGNSATRSDVHYLGTRDGVDIAFKTSNVERMRITSGGQVNVVSPVTGSDNNRNNYPLVVEGSNQGIWIKVKDSRTGSNNFLTFRDLRGTQGRVEGQTTGEFFQSSDFIRTTALYTANAVIIGLKVGAGFAKIGGFAASIFGVAGAAPEAVDVAGWIADGVAISVAYFNWLAQKLIQIGVSYSSGSGDFAEYIPRAPGVTDLQPAQVVGLKGGRVSLNTHDAEHILVVSMAPAILGNAPEGADRSNYEKVAFMGQVLVRVAGPVAIGDYILPSGNNDGFGVAVHPEQLLPHEYKNIVGVAWEAAADEPINYVNVAIGLNQNDLAQKTAQLQWQVDNITNYLEGKEPLLRQPDPLNDKPELVIPEIKSTGAVISLEDYDRVLEANEGLIRYHVEKAFTSLEEQGYNIRSIPELQKYYQDPVGYLKSLRRTPGFEAQWKAMETIIQEEFAIEGQ